MTFTCTGFRRPRPKSTRFPNAKAVHERRPKWVNGRIKRYGPSRRAWAMGIFVRAFKRSVLASVKYGREQSARAESLLRELYSQPRPPVTGKFIVVPVNGGRTVKP